MTETPEQKISNIDVQINTSGGGYIGGNVSTSGGPFIGRDLIIQANQTLVAEPPAPEQPPSTQGFVGREVELAHYAESLRKSGVAMITGMPGVGKTTLAAVLAQRMTNADNIYWHTFLENEDASILVEKFAIFLAQQGQKELWRMLQGARQNNSQPPPLEIQLDYLLQYLAGQHYLLCLDNFQFVEAGPILENFVERLLNPLTDHALMVIVTARHHPSFMQSSELSGLAGLNLIDTQALLMKRLPSLSTDLVTALHANTGGNAQFLNLAIEALRSTTNPARLIEHLVETDNIASYLLNRVDARLTEDQRTLMRVLAIFLGYPETYNALEIITGKNIRRTLRSLCEHYLVTVSGDEFDRKYSQHSIVQALYYNDLEEDKRCKLHQQAGEYYWQENDFIQAATHWHRAGNVEVAATTLYDNFRALVNTGKSRALYDLQTKFPKGKLSGTTWAKLKIAAGRAAILAVDIPTALVEFGEALSTSDIYYQAQALYYRAQAFKTVSYGESLNHFNQGIQILQDRAADARYAELLVDLYIGLAWLYIEESQNLTEAESNLSKAETLIVESDFWRQCNLYNAWSGLYFKQKDTEKELKYLHDAWMASTKTDDSEIIINTAHNLGQAWIWAGKPEIGFEYLKQALVLSIDIGNLQRQGKCYGTMGVGYFFQAQYEQAIDYYKLAYAAYQKTGNLNWLGWACYDLAEAYAKTDNREQSENYLKQATAIAEKLGAQDLRNALTQLAEQFRELLG